ncbi:MAG TPA: hypothetical protein PLM07_01310 [Candidatus Rifleibacterium sp.]|nr:hypothetical protein [Candidatus Rifleibacterium sp.]HPT44516.1 hypothetical protein [Candidatus Rifleibacterium sp.]
MQAFRLVFVDEGGQQVDYDLLDGCCTPAVSDAPPPGPQILVLPAAAALPFLVELPFSDQAKIARVLPQFVADQYVDVDTHWLFSWLILPVRPGETICRVAGLAFPPQFAALLSAAGSRFRLAIPDVLLAQTESDAAIRLKTPVSSVIAVFCGNYAVKRLFSVAAGLPVEALLAGEGSESLSDVDLLATAAGLPGKISALLASEHENLDLSGFRRCRKAGLRRLVAVSALSLLALSVILWHLFVWFECRITERAAQRTRTYMQQAFSGAFPGIPVVEPLTQTARSIAELEKRLKEAATVPRLPWQRLIHVLSQVAGPDTAILRLTGRDNGLKLSGVAVNYAALEGLRGRLETSGLFERVNTQESRQSDAGITFNLEAPWKK